MNTLYTTNKLQDNNVTLNSFIKYLYTKYTNKIITYSFLKDIAFFI